MFGLIDGNSFYCSCERAFDPKLWGKPLIVLSNNDGCAIARISEAKKLGVKMGAPWHLIKDNPAMKTVEWRSSNYELYGDMSRRMYQVLEELFPAVEAYSIDEMFLDLRGLSDVNALTHFNSNARSAPTSLFIKSLRLLGRPVVSQTRKGSGCCGCGLGL
jgi:DNA polymerase V